MDVSFDQSLAAVTLVVDGSQWGSGVVHNLATVTDFSVAPGLTYGVGPYGAGTYGSK